MPSVTISGIAAIEDNYIYASSTDRNCGASTAITVGKAAADGVRRTVMRLSAESIPLGSITSFACNLYRYANGGSTAAGTLQGYAISAANTWAEGTVVGAQQVGSSCWSHAKFNTQAWAGTAGCSTIGVDYDNETPATLAFGSYPAGVDVSMTFELKPSWAVEWRNGRVNNGFIIKEAAETDGKTALFRSTENATNQPTFTIQYLRFPGGHRQQRKTRY